MFNMNKIAFLHHVNKVKEHFKRSQKLHDIRLALFHLSVETKPTTVWLENRPNNLVLSEH